jgi:hypothetical protein
VHQNVSTSISSSHNGSALGMTFIRMINIEHTKIGNTWWLAW